VEYNLPNSLPFDIGSTRFVAGAFWHKAMSNLRKERAANTADLKPAHVITRTNAGQFGICRLEEEEKPRFWELYQSAAAALSDADPTDWLAAYQLGPDHVWVIANRDGIIEHDAVYSTRQAAKDEFEKRYNSRTWPKAVAPTDWLIDGTQTESVDRAMIGLKGPVLLPSFLFKDIPLKKAAVPLAVGAALVLLLATAVTYIPDYISFETEEVAETPQPEPALTVLRAARPSVVPLPVAADVCVSAIYKLFLRARTLPGWEVGSVDCDGSTVSTSVRATSIASLAAVVNHLPGSRLDVTSRMAEVSYVLDAVEPVELSATLSDPYELQVILARLSDAYQMRFLTEKIPVTLPGGSPPPSTLQWSLKTKAPPMFWTEALSTLPAAALTSIEFNPSASEWSIGGIAHVS